MAKTISFKTTAFDTTKERPNPFNPIAGESVLVWLRTNVLKEPYSSTEPDAEDWGWYIDVTIDGATYLVCASAETEEDETVGEEIEWLIQIEKHRTFKDRVFGRNKMSDNDPLAAKILEALKNESAFLDVKEESHA